MFSGVSKWRMRTIFSAAKVTFGPLEYGVQHLGWSKDAIGVAGHFIIERSSDQPNEPDWGYCLIADGRTYYGGIVAASVGVGETVVTLTPEAAEALGTETEIVFRYRPDATDSVVLREQLTRLLERHS